MGSGPCPGPHLAPPRGYRDPRGRALVCKYYLIASAGTNTSTHTGTGTCTSTCTCTSTKAYPSTSTSTCPCTYTSAYTSTRTKAYTSTCTCTKGCFNNRYATFCSYSTCCSPAPRIPLPPSYSTGVDTRLFPLGSRSWSRRCW